MTFKTNVIAASAIFAVIAFASCSKMENKPSLSSNDISNASLQSKISENGTNPDEAIFAGATSSSVNHFYILSNRKSGNSVLVFFPKKQMASLYWKMRLLQAVTGLAKVWVRRALSQ